MTAWRDAQGAEPIATETPAGSEERLYRDLAAAFDAVAPRYDATFGPSANGLMICQRERSLALLTATFPAGSHLLEIGCGTGDEAIALARLGRRVTATDVSPAMVARTVAKAKVAGVADRIVARALPAARLGEVADVRPYFDGAYSSFGALNCEPALDLVAAGLRRLLPRDGRLVVSVVNRWCLWEWLWFGVHGDFSRARRRLRSPFAPAEIAGEVVPLRCLDTRRLAAALDGFVAQRVYGFGVLLPPPLLNPLFAGRPRLTQLLDRLDRRLMGTAPFNRLGDHIAVVLQRRERGGLD